MSAPLILIVDDDADIRDAFQEFLADEGFRVAVAAHGQEALERLRGESEMPALILLDLMMPVMDGYQFRQIQRQDPVLAEIPVIVFSAGRERIVDDSADFFPKPVDIDALLARIRELAG